MPGPEIGDTFFDSIKVYLLIGNFFCAIPLRGLFTNDISHIDFRWLYWRTFMNIFITFLDLVLAIFFTYINVKGGFKVMTLANAGFFLNCFAAFSLFLILSKDWVAVLEEWKRLEERINDTACRYKIKLKRKIFIISSTFLTLTVVNSVANTAAQFIVTFNNKGNMGFFEYYYTSTRLSRFFETTSYAFWKGFIVEALIFIGNFCWTYVDVFIMLNGIALSLKFKQITFKIEQYVQMEVSDVYLWKAVREDYYDLCVLTKTVDKSLSNLVLLSSTNIFYYILSQRFYGIGDIQNVGLKVCFLFSLVLSVGRNICVFLFTASVNLESTKPLKALCSIEPDFYNIEVERLIRFISADPVYLTGKNFFKIRRGILLDIANALVTCEIVLVQYFGTAQIKTLSLCKSVEFKSSKMVQK